MFKKISVLVLSASIILSLSACELGNTASNGSAADNQSQLSSANGSDTSKSLQTGKSTNNNKNFKNNIKNKTNKNSNNTKNNNNNTKTTNNNASKINNLYSYLKNFAINNGTVKGDYSYYSQSANNYGGYEDENFNLSYWANSGKVEFCLHSVIDDECSINFYLYIPKTYSGNYNYLTSYYYRDSGESICESSGVIKAGEFTNNHPLNSYNYKGSDDLQDDFLEMSRDGICDLINCLGQFLQKEKTGYTLTELGFKNF